MKIILGEAFFNEIVLSWEGGRIYNPLRTVKEKNSCSQGKCRSLYGYWNVTPLQHATNSIKEGLPKFYFRPGYRSNFPYSRHQGGPRQISVLRKRPWYVKKRCCKFFSLRVTAWLRIVNPPTFSRKHYFIEKCFTQNYFHPEFPVKHLKKSIKKSGRNDMK